MSEEIQNNYKALRLFNWVFALIIFSGVILIFLTSKVVSTYLIITLLFLIVILSNYVFTAIAINPNFSTFLGFPISITKANSKVLTALIVLNSLLSVFGVAIIIACIATQQYLASISGFLYLVLSGFNVKALIQCKA